LKPSATLPVGHIHSILWIRLADSCSSLSHRVCAV
jgi:hypothetical protein